MAAVYDTFTAGYQHARWLTGLEALARKHGLRGGDVLDVACGTGKSLAPLLALGYRGRGCDISEQMLAVAAHRLPGVELAQADMRALPDLGSFAWITCLNDAVNYLLEDDDLAMALASMGSLLLPDGLVTFDINSLREHEEGFAATWVVEGAGEYLCWRGRGCSDGRGRPGSADIDIFVRRDESWVRDACRHVQRWWSHEDVVEAAEAAGLSIVARYGQHRGAVLRPIVDERSCRKIVYFMRPQPGVGGRGGAA